MAPWILWTNCSLTRRKSFCRITNPQGEVMFGHRHFWPCVEWLDRESVLIYEVQPSEAPRGARIATLLIDRSN